MEKAKMAHSEGQDVERIADCPHPLPCRGESRASPVLRTPINGGGETAAVCASPPMPKAGEESGVGVTKQAYPHPDRLRPPALPLRGRATGLARLRPPSRAGQSHLKIPPPLTPPHKGEGNERGSPSPLWGGDRGGGIANRPWRKSERDSHLFPVVSPFALFLSDFDLPAANALARLVGAAEFPPSPWRGHIAAIGS